MKIDLELDGERNKPKLRTLRLIFRLSWKKDVAFGLRLFVWLPRGPDSRRNRFHLQTVGKVSVRANFQSSNHKGDFTVVFRMLSPSGVSHWRFCVYLYTLFLINCFDATVEIWTMKFDAIKAYHLIRNGIMHNSTSTSNWFVSGLVIVRHVFLPLSFKSQHTNPDGFSTTHTIVCLNNNRKNNEKKNSIEHKQ